MSTSIKNTIWLLNDPQIAERIKQKIISNRFSDYIGLQYTSIAEGVVEAMIPMQDNLRQQNDFLHGGVTATLCDIVAGFAAYTLLPITEQVVTAEIKISYYHPAIGDVFYAKGWVEKSGKKLHFCESEVYTLHNGIRKVVAKATASMIVIRQV